MWIQVEFNPDLALRDISFYYSWERVLEECIPEKLEVWEIYNFLKSGQRNYYLLLDEPVPLLKTQGNQKLSRPIWAIQILEATHFYQNGQVYTKWKYKVLQVFDINNSQIYFEWFQFLK